MTISIKYTSLHHIDHSADEVVDIDITNQGDSLNNYITRLIDEISASNNKRSFLFQRETTEVRQNISQFLNGQYEVGSLSNSARLLVVEKETQEQIAHLKKEIQKGSLFQAIITDGDKKKIIISKADHNQYLDEKDFQLHRGLPWKKKVFKAVLINVDSSDEIEDVYVFDTNTTMSKYWWRGYLELKEKRTDTHNTRTSLDLLDKKIFNPIKKTHPADHLILRNSAVGYFRNKEEFEVTDFVDTILTNYQPIDPSLQKDNLIAKTIALPEKWEFDTRFTIKKKEINKRVINKVQLTDSIELVLKDHVPNIREAIIAEKDAEGNKFIRIRTDEGYNRFTDEHN